jgi:hypothetical protein
LPNTSNKKEKKFKWKLFKRCEKGVHYNNSTLSNQLNVVKRNIDEECNKSYEEQLIKR